MKDSTTALLRRAIDQHNGSQSELARKLGTNRSTINMALSRGRTSPTMAGQLATMLGENPEHWIAVAALEAEPATPARSRLQRLIATERNSYLSLRRQFGRRRGKPI